MSTYLDQSLAQLEHFEGAIPWMYLDTRGHVTVGVGLMLPDVEAAQRLAFATANGVSSADEVAAEFERVHGLPMGRPAPFYRQPGAPELPAAAIADVLRQVLEGFDAELRGHFDGYDSFPDPIKLALLDMIYNLGPDGLFKGYPRLCAAVAAGNWAAAAAGCHRNGPGAERNQWTRDQFASVLGKVEASAIGAAKAFGFGLLGMSAAAVEWAQSKVGSRKPR
jgi:GH24 family phage-related lysozyme (muramidase)